MSVDLIEGFDHMSTLAKFATKGWTFSSAITGGHSIITGRVNGRAIRTNVVTDNSHNFQKSLPATLTDLIGGFAFRIPTRSLTRTYEIYNLRAGSTNTVRLRVRTDGKLEILNSAGTVLGTGGTALTDNVWYYAELRALVNGASGAVELKLDGATEVASVTVNIGSSGITNVRCIVTLSSTIAAPGTNVDFDDLYIIDRTASPNQTFLGSVNGLPHVETIFPTAEGAHSAWTPNTGTDNSALVDENSGTYPDDDTTYVSETTQNDIDTYVMANLAALNSVAAIQKAIYARKDDANAREIAAVTRPVSTDYVGATVALTTGYASYLEIDETNPETAAAWTTSEINASEFGVKLIT